ncbi:MAG TPA: hypothetical protein VNL15_05675 [Dehalococcoidia bacterium]|nr:hypothetical protein [Dehalococcoidia bacterium]
MWGGYPDRHQRIAQDLARKDPKLLLQEAERQMEDRRARRTAGDDLLNLLYFVFVSPLKWLFSRFRSRSS